MGVSKKHQAHIKTKASIKSVPTEIVVMFIEILTLQDAVELCKTLKLPEQMAVQYFYYDENIAYIPDYPFLEPNSYKFLLKNKRFQIKASSGQKIQVALKTYDLDFVKNYIEEFKPDLEQVLLRASWIGFTDAVKFLMSDYRVSPSARDNQALKDAAFNGHTETVKLLVSDGRLDPSASDNEALIYAANDGYTEIVKLLLSDSRVNPSARNNQALRKATDFGHVEIVKLLLSDSRVDLSAEDVGDLIYNAKRDGHLDIVKVLESFYARFQEA